MDDPTLATINVEQLNQAINHIIPVNHQQAVSTPGAVGSTTLPLNVGSVVSQLGLSSINLSHVGNLPQILNLLPVSDTSANKQAATEPQSITLATDNPQLQQQLSALSIPLSRIIQAKDLQATQLMIQNQNIPANLAIHPQGQPVIQQAGQPVIQQAGQPILQQSQLPAIQQQNQAVVQQAGQTVIQTAELPVLTAKSLQQAIAQCGNVGNFSAGNETLSGPLSIVDNSGNTILTVISSGNTLQQPARPIQSTAPLLVLPGTTSTTQNAVTVTSTQNPVTITSPSSSCAVNIHDILPQGAEVQDVHCNQQEVQDKENASHEKSGHNQSGLPSLSDLELILKSSGANGALNVPTTDKVNLPPVKVEGIYCVDCNAKYIDTCPRHGREYQIINDSPILSRARMSVPHKLNLRPSLANECTTGVFTREKLESRVRFGPLEGTTYEPNATKEEENKEAFLWKVLDGDKCVKIINCYDEAVANWMRFVQVARNCGEQNLVAYQQNQHIYFVTCKPVEADTELLFWYAKDYAALIDVPANVADMAKCGTCYKQFPSVAELKQHKKYSHADMSSRKWKCQWCSKAFPGSQKLRVHLLSHMGVKPHKCQYCNKQFTDLSNLRTHTLLHTGEKKFQCEVCDRAFTQKAHLASHMVCHTKEKNYSCQYCNATFGRSSDLKAHEYKHTKERQFSCLHCSKMFYTSHSFKRHIKTHTGERDFPCDLCGKAFVTKYHRERHLKTCKGAMTVAGEDAMPKKKKKRAKISDIS